MNKKITIYLIVILSVLLVASLVLIAFLLGKKSVIIPKSDQIGALSKKENNKKDIMRPPKTDTKQREELTKSVSDIAKEEGSATVFIATYSKIGLELGLGSGFIISSDGKIVTNFHVIDNAYAASIKLTNGDVYDDVNVIEYDERRDIAIIKIKGFNLPVVNMGDSDEVKIGERVVAIGNPAGLENSISDGIVSATRDMEGYKLLQITAPISPGSSGGPVYNMKGKIIGIATSTIEGAQNLNFALPINYIKPLINKEESIKLDQFQEGFQKKKWIGGTFDVAKRKSMPQKEEKNIGYLGVFWDLTQPEDVLKIWKFRKYSLAREAGLMIGDEIIQMDDFKFKGTKQEEHKQFFLSKKEGDVITLKILRGSEEKEIKVIMGNRPKTTNAIESIGEYLFLGEKVRLAIMVDDISIISPDNNVNMQQEWKMSVRRNIINGQQNALISSFGNNKNFSIIDIGKIDIIINDLQSQYGALPPQVRNNVLESLGVTHLIEVSCTRYHETKFLQNNWLGNGGWKDKLEDTETDKFIDLMLGEVICVDNFQRIKDYNDKEFGEFKNIDLEDREFYDYLKGMEELRKKKDSTK